MSGIFQHWSESAPGGRLEVEAAIRERVREAMAATQVTQQQAGRFFREFGSDVLDGHVSVGRPGDLGADPDTRGADESDLPNE